MPSPSAEPAPTFAAMLARSHAFIGACIVSCVAVILGILVAIDVHPPESGFIGNFLIGPAIAGGVFGAIVGWAVGATRRRDTGLFASVVAWILMSAAAVVFGPAVLGLLYGWAIGIGSSGFPLRGTGPSVTPFSAKALSNAFGHVSLFVVFLGLLAAAVGAIVGSIIAAIKWGNRKVRAQNAPNELERKDFT